MHIAIPSRNNGARNSVHHTSATGTGGIPLTAYNTLTPQDFAPRTAPTMTIPHRPLTDMCWLARQHPKKRARGKKRATSTMVKPQTNQAGFRQSNPPSATPYTISFLLVSSRQAPTHSNTRHSTAPRGERRVHQFPSWTEQREGHRRVTCRLPTPPPLTTTCFSFRRRSR